MTLDMPVTKVLQQFPSVTVLTTHDRESWKGVAVEQIELRSEYSMQKPAHDYHVVCYLHTGKSRLIQRRDGKTHEGKTFSGMATIRPKGCSAIYEGEPVAVTSLQVPDELIAKAANEMNGHTTTSYEIMNVFQTCDPAIGHFIDLFLSELNRPVHPAQVLISDAISSALAGHLLRSYNAFDIQEQPGCLLGQHVLSRIIAYIEEYAASAIRLDELANIAGVSRFHFSRIFKASTGISPMAFVEQSRIRKAQQLIRSGQIPLAEIALIVGFADQSHFTRRFKRYTGCTPAVFVHDNGIRRPVKL